jgi:beta-galactosidase/beta-glucuronidase
MSALQAKPRTAAGRLTRRTVGAAWPAAAALGWIGLALGAMPAWGTTVPLTGRWVAELGGAWEFQTNGAPPEAWKRIEVPSEFESHEGTNFNGAGWYRRSWPADPVPAGRRQLIEFEAAATEAEVWVDGRWLGSHLGGWTPFRFDLTEVLAANPGPTREVRVRLDEKVGHNTQGFLPVVQPHFGGLWQRVRLWTVPETYIDDLRLRAAGTVDTGNIELDVPLIGAGADRADALVVRYALAGGTRWTETHLRVGPRQTGTADAVMGESRGRASRATLTREGTVLRATVPVAAPRRWSPADPQLYEVELVLPARGGAHADRVRTRAAFRKIETAGGQLRLNGAALNVRGLLNWGYYPPNLAPRSDPAAFRRDLVFARERGFNLMKFCLWVPPRTYLDLCDELGMLAWMEYPTWHPRLTPEFLGPLRQEFTEFFAFDRNHPSVVLRSLTCETGSGADLDVIRSLYDLAHGMIPGAVVEDDSSWIEWNRVSDIYDDHPYGNNHTWVATLGRLREYARTNGPKPLVLGEAIAADTWVSREAIVAAVGSARPYWVPSVLDRQPAWVERMAAIAGPGGLDRLGPESLRYALAMRKFQAEVFRREVPDGGYVISVIRDIPGASMGLCDYLGEPKWPAQDWAWQGDTVCLLATPDDARSVVAGERLRGAVWISHFGTGRTANARLTVTVTSPDLPQWPAQVARADRLDPPEGALAKGLSLDFAAPQTDRPVRLTVNARLEGGPAPARNQWTLWVVPPQEPAGGTTIRRHESLASDRCAAVFGTVPPAAAGGDPPDAVWVATRLDDAAAQFLENGGRVLLLANGEPGSFRTASHWFLRGAPYVPEHALASRVPRDLLVDLQAFDLAGDILPDLTFLDEVDPILLLWDTHDHGTVKTHGLVFETQVARGRLMVSVLRHDGTNNAAGRWLAAEFARHLAQDPAPRRGLSAELWAGFKARLKADRLPLTQQRWHFRPDPQAVGVKDGWAGRELDDSGWGEIQVGRHWESQGHEAVDGWAWYRLWVDMPERWRGRPVYLTFEGVDDCYELFVDGRLVARRGDPTTRVDTFNETFSHDLSAVLKPGTRALLAVRVYDWYGAGGIFRPVTLATVPHDPRTEAVR